MLCVVMYGTAELLGFQDYQVQSDKARRSEGYGSVDLLNRARLVQRGALDLFNTGICRNTRWCDGVGGGVR